MIMPTEGDITRLLEAKHSKDVVVTGCKTGSTWYASELRVFDVWIMPRSWKNFITKGYEIKVSRQDFINDTKWRKYLEFCHEFYFVAPPGVIDKSELPAEAGLLVTSTNCKKLYMKKKAPYRGVEIQTDIFIYIIMCRARISANEYEDNARKFWQNWMKDKKIDRVFGYRVSKAIKTRIEEEITEVRDKQKRLEREIEGLKGFKTACEKLEITPEHFFYYNPEEKIRKRIKILNSAFPEGFIGHLVRTIENLQNLQKLIEGEKLS